MAAIPTLYRGIQMRSRLEAKWACVFDQLGWKWEYEPVDLAGWIPDFLIQTRAPNKPLLVEIKPVLERPEAVCDKCYRLAIPEGYQVLVVGMSPVDARGEHRFGWIAPSMWEGCVWDEAAILTTDGKKFGLSEKNNAFEDRINVWKDDVNDDHYHKSQIYSGDFKPIWNKATNKAQWKAPR